MRQFTPIIFHQFCASFGVVLVALCADVGHQNVAYRRLRHLQVVREPFSESSFTFGLLLTQVFLAGHYWLGLSSVRSLTLWWRIVALSSILVCPLPFSASVFPWGTFFHVISFVCIDMAIILLLVHGSEFISSFVNQILICLRRTQKTTFRHSFHFQVRHKHIEHCPVHDTFLYLL